MTSCDPDELRATYPDADEVLGDDPDVLMDRPEYWVVVKNVPSDPTSEIGDELTFKLTDDGQYGHAFCHVTNINAIVLNPQ